MRYRVYIPKHSKKAKLRIWHGGGFAGDSHEELIELSVSDSIHEFELDDEYVWDYDLKEMDGYSFKVQLIEKKKIKELVPEKVVE